MSFWKSQLCGKEGYFLQFETKDYETYRRVEKLCQDIIDEENEKREAEKEYIPNPLIGYFQPKFVLEEDKIVDTTFIPDACRHCPNHPSNGGAGYCNCTLGDYKITANTYTTTATNTTDTLTITIPPNTNDTVYVNQLTEKQFIETYCDNCGTQRCEGIGTEWFDGCRHRHELKGYKEN